MKQTKDKYAKFRAALKKGDSIVFRANDGDNWTLQEEPEFNAPVHCYKIVPRTYRAAIPKNGGNDNIMTPPELAYAIVEHFEPRESVNDPCGGERVFGLAFERFKAEHFHKNGLAIYESDIRGDTASGKICNVDFLPGDGNPSTKWLITNPPWSLLKEFLEQAMQCAKHIVFLTHCNAWFTNARVRMLAQNSFSIREIAYVDRPKEWVPMGLQLAAIYIAHDEEPDRWTGKKWDGKTSIGPLPV